MYYLLAGQYPFPDGSAAEKMMAHQFKKPESLAKPCAGDAAGVIALIEKLMQKKPEDRFTSVGEIVEELPALRAEAQ